jgi:hypothetical protein
MAIIFSTGKHVAKALIAFRSEMLNMIEVQLK